MYKERQKDKTRQHNKENKEMKTDITNKKATNKGRYTEIQKEHHTERKK